MKDTNATWKDFVSLPPEARREVMDYIAFLKQRYSPLSQSKAKERTPLAGDPFIGMWQDRQDMRDSSGWVRKVREGEWDAKDA